MQRYMMQNCVEVYVNPLSSTCGPHQLNSVRMASILTYPLQSHGSLLTWYLASHRVVSIEGVVSFSERRLVDGRVHHIHGG